MSHTDDHIYEDYIYTVFGNNAMCIAEMNDQGIIAPYPAGSTNGELFTADLANDTGAVCEMAPEKPSYVTQEMPNWPKLTWEEARQLTGYPASSKGASDGYTYFEPVVI